jgi:pilus assembly protein CpaB
MQIQRVQRILPLIIALACGIWAVILLDGYLKRREGEIWDKIKRVQQQLPPPPAPAQMGIVLVAARDIPSQSPVTPADLLIKEVPVDYIQPGAITALGEITGQITAAPISAGEQVLKTKLLPPGKIGRTLAEVTPAGKRAVNLPKASLSGVTSFIQPGDHVDMFALIVIPDSVDQYGKKSPGPRLIPLFQAVEVLAVGGEFISSGEKRTATGAEAGTITLALVPQEAALISFVQEHGKLKLELRSSEDTQKEQIKPADWDTLLQYLYPSREVGTEAKGPLPMVEVYRGLNKENIPLREK